MSETAKWYEAIPEITPDILKELEKAGITSLEQLSELTEQALAPMIGDGDAAEAIVKRVAEIQARETGALVPGTPEEPAATDEPEEPATTDEPEEPAATDEPEEPVTTDEPEEPGATDEPEETPTDRNPGDTAQERGFFEDDDPQPEPPIPAPKPVKDNDVLDLDEPAPRDQSALPGWLAPVIGAIFVAAGILTVIGLAG